MFKFFTTKKWFPWSILGSALILLSTWYQVQLDVEINKWFGSFYDLIQKALQEPDAITLQDFYQHLWTFISIAGTYVVIAVVLDFFIQHYIFRWRTSMNEYFVNNWQALRHVEGAAQRVQEDTRMFAGIMQGLGVDLMRSVLTLIAFLPILFTLSAHVTEMPFFGEVDASLVWVAIIFALLGTVGLAILGIKLPGLEYNNQVVEARYRKELVYGEDDEKRAQRQEVETLFSHVRRNYFRLFWNYLYFNIGKWSYLQVGVLVPYIALGPTIVAGVITLGVLQQIVRAFGRVVDSFQFLVHSWSTIVELISVYKRLREFEKQIVKFKNLDSNFNEFSK